MLKKIAHILLVFLFLGSATGMTISKHYCGTTLKSISINSTPDSCCGSACKRCHNESFTIKIENEFSLFTNNFDFNTQGITLPVATELIRSEVFETELIYATSWEGPPPKIQSVLSKLQVYLL